MVYVRHAIGVHRILLWRGFTGVDPGSFQKGAEPGGLGGRPVESRGKAPVGGVGDEVLQRLKQNVKLAYNF